MKKDLLIDSPPGMKYPQLVSSRAVNAISDWLVSRLEQLGVESPLIYSRLLLSLLQSSIQLNDPIEFNNLEVNIKKKQKPNFMSDSVNYRRIFIKFVLYNFNFIFRKKNHFKVFELILKLYFSFA